MARRRAYADVFGTFAEEESTLAQLYSPLQRRLSGEDGTLGKLTFTVDRKVDIDAWVKRGESLLDLRAGRFRGRGALKAAVEASLSAKWRTGGAADVATAMDQFVADSHKELIAAMPSSVGQDEQIAWKQSLATWLYSTDHVTAEYGMRYAGVRVEQLSPGTRGIVLLLVYLALDTKDPRPLIIDQPEENLDPKSVFAELVPHFRAARRRRQVIIVTHNANLVVNTDADQVVVATAIQDSAGLPRITYRSGSLECREIREKVCLILEGGEQAFRERERRYRLDRHGSGDAESAG